MGKKLVSLLYLIFMVLTINSTFAVVEDIKVNLIEYSPNPIQPGEVMDIYLEVSASSVSNNEEYSDVSLEIIEDYPFIVEDSQDKFRALNLGEVSYAQRLHFRVRINKDAKDGITPLRVRHKSDKNSPNFYETQFDINIETFDARVNILSINQEPKELEPGQIGNLTITLQNMDDTMLNNIAFILDLTNTYDVNSNMESMLATQARINARLEDVNRRVASGQSPLIGLTPMTKSDSKMEVQYNNFYAISPVESSNQKKIEKLNPQEIINVTFPVRAMPDILPNIYAIPIYINYNDENNNPFNTRAEIPIIVDMKPELFLELRDTTLRTTDFSGILSVVIANRGLNEMDYVSIKLEENGEFDILNAPSSIYVGNLKSGESKVVNFTIIAHNKELKFPFQIEFRDSFNKEFEEKRELSLEIINKNYYRDISYEMWLVWIVLGIVVFLLTLFYVFHINKKKSKEK